MSDGTPVRCGWAGSDPLYCDYHDHEWGRPVAEGRALFECLMLEGAQAGLSWITILRKREHYRAAFEGFDPERIARFNDGDVARLLGNPGIVRHRGKIEATLSNARAWLALAERHGDPAAWLWALAGGMPRTNVWNTLSEVPAATPDSDRMSRTLKQAGFRFVGSTTCYAFMQAVGMVDDHLTTCFCRAAVAESAASFRPPSVAPHENSHRTV